VFDIRLCCAAVTALMAGMATACAEPSYSTAAASSSPFAAFATADSRAADGSTLSLRLLGGGLSRLIVTPGGQPRRTDFILLNDRLGTVSEGDGNVVGLFVIEGTNISTVYADGRSEILGSDASGRFSILAKDGNGGMICASWYPPGRHSGSQERSEDCVSDSRIYQRTSASPPADGEQQPFRSQDGVLRGIMARVFAFHAGKQPAVPTYGDSPVTGAHDTSPSWDAFDRFYSVFVASHEGGYTENDGNGAPANFGINQGANPDIDVVALTQPQAEQILYERYWLASGADRLPAALAAVHGDTAINMGVRGANELLAQSGGDPNTYLDLRHDRYQAIAAASPDRMNALPVWLRRNEDLRALVNNGTALVDWPSDTQLPPQRRISALTAGDPDR